MKFPIGRALLCVLAILFPTFGHAQLSIRYFPSHPPKDGSIPQICLDAGASLRTEMSKFPVPTKWTFVIACDTAAWDNLMALANHADRSRSIFGATNPDNSSTLMRGSTLLGRDEPEMSAEHMVAHELAHIYMHSPNERLVDMQALAWIKANPTQIAGVR
jgi:hypothetical protein